MAFESVELEANVGVLRDPRFLKDPRSAKIANEIDDQRKLARLLSLIPVSEGGRKGTFPPTNFQPSRGTCHPELANAIHKFQTHWQTKNFFPIMEGVVRPKGNTIKKLNELAAVKAIADIVVFFQGQTAQAELNPGSALPSDNIPGYVDLDGGPATSESKIVKHLVDDRLLLRLGWRTNTVGSASKFVFDSTMKAIRDRIESANAEIDRIYLYGSSSGARNVLDFVKVLDGQALSAKLRLIVVTDVPFFDADSRTVRPKPPPTAVLTSRDPGAVPEFTVALPPGSYSKINFYQTHGNHARMTRLGFGEWVFTSNVSGPSGEIIEEIHGTIIGFDNRTLDAFIERVPPGQKDNDNSYHANADTEGNDRARKMIRAELLAGRTLPPNVG